MTNKEREAVYLQHILECIDGIPEHMRLLPAGTDWHEHFTVREAVLRTLQVMAESCTRLTAEAYAATPEIPWENIRAFRHILVHDYLGSIDYAIVTDTIENDLPRLRAAVERMLKSKKGAL